MTREQFIVEQAARLQVADYPQIDDHFPTLGEAVKAYIHCATALADELGMADEPAATDAYTVPRAVGDAYMSRWDDSAKGTHFVAESRNLYDCLKAQQQEARQ